MASTYGYSGKETFWDVGDDDTDEEDDGLEGCVLEDDRDNEESDSQEDSDTLEGKDT